MLELLLLSCLFLVVRSTAGAVPPPQNLSLVWVNDFQPVFSWEPPQTSMNNCLYNGSRRTQEEDSEVTFLSDSSKTNYSEDLMIMEGGFLHFSLKTSCGENESEPVVLEVHYPELVTNWTCHSTTVKQAYCSWSPAQVATDLQFLYRFSDDPSIEYQCSLYKSLGDGKTGCDLQPTASLIIIGFKATVNNTLVRNTFTKNLLFDARPPPLTWNITKTPNTFNINWVPPEIFDPSEWTLQIKYNECAVSKHLECTNCAGQYQLIRIPHCQYCIQIQAVNSLHGQTPPSEKKCFDADFSPLVFAATFIPLVIAFMVVVAYCCWAFRNSLFPKVPKPRDLLSDYSSSTVNFLHKLYIPAEEEENCYVTLVEDTPTKKPNC